ncbi:uncharacterized protein FIESC28_02348 [Fusarium coffeatum]|uniref:non-specific serine/threonine protein kinase n=1 Tax=Fusarium coffeatum TaxID=231269 RepID=A0A366S7H7_9HYPO|nr:uncharacterized protein FIESC28_02348 [Fusarium coffeatum]RBR24858.1 hypothetical protein FIESC28_02348 [Fusarium coffeatum]
MDLDHVLRHKMCPQDHPSKLEPGEQLSEHWLWRQIAGVCCALSVFHREMKNPFPDISGTVIGVHFDLKLANILVTADGKLKMTDFGQSIIRILGEGEDMTMPHNPGDFRYAAPESRPTLGYVKDNPEDIEVLLNYDVWSLGCIMVEVLLHMLDVQTLEAFDQALGKVKPAGFFTGTGLKQCVNSLLEDVRHIFRNSAQRYYIATITDLIRAMLRHDVKGRPYSWQVLDELQRAQIMELAIPRDRVTLAVVQYELKDRSYYRDCAFRQPTFSEVRQTTMQGSNADSFTWCGLQLDKSHMTSHSFSSLKPFKASRYGTLQIFAWSDILTWLNTDVLTFQGTLMERTIFPPINASVKAMKPKRPSIWSKERQSPVFNQRTSYIQLLAGNDPIYYGTPAMNIDSRKFRAVSIPSSITPTTISSSKDEDGCRTMVIFFEGLSPVVIALNDDHEVFRASTSGGKVYVSIVNRRGHESYSVRQLPAHPAWQSQNLNETPHTRSSILLEANYQNISKAYNKESFKMEGIEIVLESLQGEIVYTTSSSFILTHYQTSNAFIKE